MSVSANGSVRHYPVSVRFLALGVALCVAGPVQAQTAPRLAPPGASSLLPPAPPPAAQRLNSGGLEDLTMPQGAPALPPPAAGVAPLAATAQPNRTPEDEAFENAVKQMVPLSPDQIREFRKRQDDARRATSLPIVPLKPVTRTISLTLKPGEPTPVIRVSAQRVTTLTFVDLTGKPWPVLATATGDPLTLQVNSAGVQNETNIITLSPLKSQGATNIAVTLMKYPVPIVMSVTTGESEVDYRVDVRISSRGPNATVESAGISNLGPTDDNTMISFIDGTPPRGAEKVSSQARDVEGWMYDKMLYVRTTAELMSPAYIAKSAGNAGVNVYKLVETPVLIVSRDGKMDTVLMRR